MIWLFNDLINVNVNVKPNPATFEVELGIDNNQDYTGIQLTEQKSREVKNSILTSYVLKISECYRKSILVK